MRIGVASIVQESNTFALQRSTMRDFESQGLFVGSDIDLHMQGTNTEIAGAIDAIRRSGAEPVPIIRAWAMSSGRLQDDAFETLAARLRDGLREADHLDGLVLSLHGALAAESCDSADTGLARIARLELGSSIPIGVCLDLHANVTQDLIDAATFVIGYHTYPHVDQGATGARAASLIVDACRGTSYVTALAKRPMILPPETTSTGEGPLGEVRRVADRMTVDAIVDISLFPVQPWLDVPDLGFAVTVTCAGELTFAERAAVVLADDAWRVRHDFVPTLLPPAAAIDRARQATRRPTILSQSSDAPTGGASGDSAAMVAALLAHAPDLRSYVTLVDRPAVEAAYRAGIGRDIATAVGATIDDRFDHPVALNARVMRLGGGAYRLTGPVFTGMSVDAGRWAVLQQDGVSVLVTELPAPTFDPTTFAHAGLDPTAADIIVVRSPTLFRPGFAGLGGERIILDLPGATTPRLVSLPYARIPRPMFPLDDA